jgi:hypothetical protein
VQLPSREEGLPSYDEIEAYGKMQNGTGQLGREGRAKPTTSGCAQLDCVAGYVARRPWLPDQPFRARGTF